MHSNKSTGLGGFRNEEDRIVSRFGFVWFCFFSWQRVHNEEETLDSEKVWSKMINKSWQRAKLAKDNKGPFLLPYYRIFTLKLVTANTSEKKRPVSNPDKRDNQFSHFSLLDLFIYRAGGVVGLVGGGWWWREIILFCKGCSRKEFGFCCVKFTKIRQLQPFQKYWNRVKPASLSWKKLTEGLVMKLVSLCLL